MYADPFTVNARFTSRAIQPREWLDRHVATLNHLKADAPEDAFRARQLFSAWGHYQRALLDYYWERRGFDDWGRFERSLAAVGLLGARAALTGISDDKLKAWQVEMANVLPTLTSALPEAVWLEPGNVFALPIAERALNWGRLWRAENPERKLCVIALRGDGENVSAALALGAETEVTPITLRLKSGAESISLSPSCAGYLKRKRRAVRFALVSEGEEAREDAFLPLVRWLEDNGVPPTRILLAKPGLSEVPASSQVASH